MSLWYFSVNGKAEGPVGEEVIIEGLKSGRFTLVDLVFREGQQGWCTLGEVEKFREVFNALPIPQPPAPVSEPIILDKTVEPKVESPRASSSRTASTASPEAKSSATASPTSTPAAPSKTKSTVDDIFASVLPKAQRSQETPPMSHYNHPAPSAPSSSKLHWSTEPAWVILKNKAGGGFEQTGPYSVVQILDMIATGEVKYSHYSWRPGYKRWVRIGNLPEFDRRKRDREGDPVNQIIPLPDQAQNVPALSRDDLMGQIERLRRPPATRAVTSSQERPPEASGQDLARLPYEIPEVVKPEMVVATPPPTSPDVRAPSETKPKLVGGADAQTEHSVPVSASLEVTREAVDPAVSSSALEGAQVEKGAGESEEEEIQARPRSMTGRAARLGLAAALATFAVITFFEFQLRNEASDANSAKKEDLASKTQDSQPADASAASKTVKQKLEEPPAAVVAEKKPVPEPVQPAAVPVAQPVVSVPTQASTLGVRPIEPSKEAPRVLEIIALKLTSQPTLVFQTDAGIAETIEVKIHGRTGEILDLPAYWERFNVKRGAGEIATLDLSKLGLPRGSYQVVATVGALQDEASIFLGASDSRFHTLRKAHLKSISAQQVRERRALYYGSLTMEKVASDLASGYRRYRLQPKKWTQFYTGWLASARTSVKDVMSLKAEAGPNGRVAFPVEIAAFQRATERLGAQAREFDLSVSQKRQLAAAADVVGADFKRIREELAEFSVNSP